MKAPFTFTVRALAAGETISDRDMNVLLQALRGVLVGAMRRRGLWCSAPRHLGIVGHDSWQAGRTPDPLSGALGELLVDCYTYVFVQRLDRLAAQLKVKTNIDGLVLLNVRHFLHDVQRRHDPLGYRIFKLTHAALRTLVDRGELIVTGGSQRIDNGTVIAWAAPAESVMASAVTLEESVRAWAIDLLPGILGARGHRQSSVVEQIVAVLTRLRDAGVRSIRVKSLLDPLKDELRRLSAARLRLEPYGVVDRLGREDRLSQVIPDFGFERRDVCRALERDVADGILQLVTRKKTKQYLETLWTFLVEQANARTGDTTSDAPGRGKLPSQRKMSTLLGIPRERMPELFTMLGALVRQAQARPAGVAFRASG